MGEERYCLQGLDHLNAPTFHSFCRNLTIYKPSLMTYRLMFEHDKSLFTDLLPIHFPVHWAEFITTVVESKIFNIVKQQFSPSPVSKVED